MFSKHCLHYIIILFSNIWVIPVPHSFGFSNFPPYAYMYTSATRPVPNVEGPVSSPHKCNITFYSLGISCTPTKYSLAHHSAQPPPNVSCIPSPPNHLPPLPTTSLHPLPKLPRRRHHQNLPHTAPAPRASLQQRKPWQHLVSCSLVLSFTCKLFLSLQLDTASMISPRHPPSVMVIAKHCWSFPV